MKGILCFRRKKWWVFWIGFFFLLLYLTFGRCGFLAFYRKQNQLHQLRVAIEKTKEECILLEREIIDLNNPTRIEKEAREFLGMVLPGERSVKFIKEK